MKRPEAAAPPAPAARPRSASPALDRPADRTEREVTPRSVASLLQLQSTLGNRRVVAELAARPDGSPPLASRLTSGGAPLPRHVRAGLEPSFGIDFSAVRIHTDARADETARSIGAAAFTVDRHIHFAAGAYEPNSAQGLRLIAHELAHVVQQRGAAPVRAFSRPGEPSEAEADRAATAATSPGGAVPVRLSQAATAAVSRQPAASARVEGLGLELAAGDEDPRQALTSPEFIDNNIDDLRLVEEWSGLSVHFPGFVIHYRDGSAMYVPINRRFLRGRTPSGQMQIRRFRRDATTGKIVPLVWRGVPEQLPSTGIPDGEVFFADDVTPNVMMYYNNAIARRAFRAAGDIGALWSIGLVATSSIQIFMSARALAMARAAAGAAGLQARQAARLAEQRALQQAEQRATAEAERRGVSAAEREAMVQAERQAAQRGAEWMGGFTHGIREEEIVALNRTFGGTTMMTGHPASAIAAAARQNGFWNKVAAMVREIAGRHMFDNGNKRTAHALLNLLKARHGVATGVSEDATRRIIDQVARGELTDVAVIARALRGF